jgi:hypothetical protein
MFMKKLKWIVAAVVISFGPQVIAATISWTNSGTGDWITPANWSSVAASQ